MATIKTKEVIFFIIFIICIALDQLIKYLLTNYIGTKDLDSFTMIKGGDIFSIALVFNRGVAFSFLSGIGEYLKYIQSVFLIFILLSLAIKRQILREYFLALAFILSGGISNVADRFIYGGVVDYIYYHYGFNFPIFNLADIFINIGLAIFIIQTLFFKKTKLAPS